LIEETFGGLDIAELRINRDELEEYDVSINIEGMLSLNDFITELTSNEVVLDLSHFQTSTIEISNSDTGAVDGEISELTRSLNKTMRENMPPIPDDAGLKTTTDDTHYRRLVTNPDSQPARYRRLIRSEVEIPRPKFDRWAERQGFKPETGGSHNASLLMLERIGEIDRRGRGDDQLIVWVGR
jgi:hypothetical protein